MKRGLVFLLVLVLFITACEYEAFVGEVLDDQRLVSVLPEAEAIKACVDADSDGYCSYEDCDDFNPKINPGVPEVCGDGLDNDCSGGDNPCAEVKDRGDDDWDGLLAYEEESYGTDINKKDTDGDGLSDGKEVKVYFTDPLNWDTDGDYYCDGGEVWSSTDPLDDSSRPVDEDKDGMGDEWEKWSFDGLTYEPNMDQDKATDRKRDGDGLTNMQEYCWGLKGWDADSDDDLLSDGEEVNMYNTDPFNWDTDNDGFADGREVSEFRTDPLDAADYAVFQMVLNKHKTAYTRNKLPDGKHYAASYRRQGALAYGQSISATGEIND